MDLPVGDLVDDTKTSLPLERHEMRGRLVSLRTPDPRAETAALYDATHL